MRFLIILILFSSGCMTTANRLTFDIKYAIEEKPPYKSPSMTESIQLEYKFQAQRLLSEIDVSPYAVRVYIDFSPGLDVNPYTVQAYVKLNLKVF